jgi:hypothetical protein
MSGSYDGAYEGRSSRKALKRHDSRTQLRGCAATRGRPCRRMAIVFLTGARPPLRICERWWRRRESEQSLDLFERQDYRAGVAAIEVGIQGHVRGRNGRPRVVRWSDPEACWHIFSMPAIPEPRRDRRDEASYRRSQVHVRHGVRVAMRSRLSDHARQRPQGVARHRQDRGDAKRRFYCAAVAAQRRTHSSSAPSMAPANRVRRQCWSW